MKVSCARINYQDLADRSILVGVDIYEIGPNQNELLEAYHLTNLATSSAPIFGYEKDGRVIVLTALSETKGGNFRNGVEGICAQVQYDSRLMFPPYSQAAVVKPFFVEYVPPDADPRSEEAFSLIYFGELAWAYPTQEHGGRMEGRRPRWKTLTRAQVEALIGEPFPGWPRVEAMWHESYTYSAQARVPKGTE